MKTRGGQGMYQLSATPWLNYQVQGQETKECTQMK